MRAIILSFSCLIFLSGCGFFGIKKTAKPETISEPETILDQSAKVDIDEDGSVTTTKTTTQLQQANAPVTRTQLNKRDGGDFGVITINRHGPGFDISLLLDTGEENVAFVMDLPDQDGDGKSSEDQISGIAKKLQTMDQNNKSEISPEEANQPQTEPSQPVAADLTLATPQNMSANDNIVLAQQLFYRRDYLGALNATLDAIEKQPNFALAHALKGSIYYKMGQKSEAKGAWEQALQIDPNMDDVRRGLEVLF